ncbi:MAG: UDP-2,3-diacylglucosamine diphosphatase LpxI [Phycisphaerales bacterium]|nr:UDP-2,3-diacylglucosamine diphosphatase LpxI [Phycisphaerales bacterium]
MQRCNPPGSGSAGGDSIGAPADTPIGLIAGAGELPLLVARNVRRAGRPLAVVALRGWADPRLRELAGSHVRGAFCWRGIVQVGRWIRALRRAGCREVVMVGRVRKAEMFAGPRWVQWLRYLPDLTTIRLWYFHVRDKRNDTLLAAVADELGRRGVTMIDSTRYIPEALAPAGLLVPGDGDDGPPRVRPISDAPRAVIDDAAFAWPLLKQIAALDIGQAVAVKEREIIAVEAIEGTDRLIERAGALCPQRGWTLVKVAKPDQDMRFDVPTIGPTTIENLARAGAVAVVVEAGRTIILERSRMLELAQRLKIAVIGVREFTPESGVLQ